MIPLDTSSDKEKKIPEDVPLLEVEGGGDPRVAAARGAERDLLPGPGDGHPSCIPALIGKVTRDVVFM